ncbi:DUF202 domain-containing protein [Streptomyces sp. NBC_00335]|uniref:DUF202 domain-containing protein n=1 Tax=unclassified Streptomyces TaxID=2593676 RepID=UPI0022533416|nr:MULTISPECIES: DUF202 domain-containing protein [unclassified Streptomyces]MCX5408290.1 DUF202 domain-containing protein [Streptomyces sp. NBC_00086]
MSSPADAADREGPEGRDAGLQPERTRLAWRRTTLSCAVVAVLALRQALNAAGGSPVAVAGVAVIALFWLAFMGVAHRRVRELAAARPAGLSAGAALAATACTVGLAVFAIALIG